LVEEKARGVFTTVLQATYSGLHKREARQLCRLDQWDLLTHSGWLWSQLAVLPSATLGDTNELLFSKLGWVFFPYLNRIVKHQIPKNRVVNVFTSFNH